MNKFYAIIIKADSQAIFRYDTVEGACDKYHTELAYGYNVGIPTTCMVVDGMGTVIKCESYGMNE